MIPKTFDAISKSDIEALVENQVREGRTIEYKQVLLGNSDEEKREFLSDISSFANAGGGDLLYGISATDGIPQDALGLESNLDAELLRLENLIRDSLDPRVHGLRMRAIDGFAKGPVLLIRIPRSWAGPHMVTFKNLSRFFTRNSAGKHQMDVLEIRSACLLADALPEKMRRFRDERLGRIIASATPVRMFEGAKLVLHILPVAAFTSDASIEVAVLKARSMSSLRPIGASGWNDGYNLDGFLTYSGPYDSAGSRAYSLLFRKGQIEAVFADLVRERDDRRFIPSVAYEEYIIQGVLGYLGVLKSLEIPSPLVLFVCMTGVANVHMGVDTFYFSHGGSPIDRDTLVLPDILVDDYESINDKNAVAGVLRPIFDAVWNACGFERSFNFDDKGNWKPRR
ncbi:MAG: ATP-binding protein [Candidatus Methylomirabilis sp.]|nr:ATP-binding protein [Deltaproteobacteria bacterium]